MIHLTLSKRERYIFIIAVVTVVSALGYIVLLEPFLKKWNTLNNQIVIRHTILRKGLRLLDKRDAIVRDYKIHASSPETISTVLSYIEKQAYSSGIKTANVKPRPGIQTGLYKEYIIELQIEGRFSSINKFVSTLIKPPMFISVKKFDLRTAAPGSSSLKAILILSKIII